MIDDMYLSVPAMFLINFWGFAYPISPRFLLTFVCCVIGFKFISVCDILMSSEWISPGRSSAKSQALCLPNFATVV